LPNRTQTFKLPAMWLSSFLCVSLKSQLQ
jgi:hypothetical protein